jgi:hypothetical protein
VPEENDNRAIGNLLDDTRKALLIEIEKTVKGRGPFAANVLRDYAEAWAWCSSPSQHHGGSAD